VQPLTADEWTDLLQNAGLQIVTSELHPVDAKLEAKLLLRRYGLGGMLGNTFRALRLYVRNPAYRDFLKKVRQVGVVPDNISEYFGYGMYVGKKA
jgi:hypothetical protein